MYMRYPTKTKSVTPVVPEREANASNASGSPPPE